MLTFPDDPANEAKHLRAEAEKLPHGREKELLLRKARQADTAAKVVKWVASPGLERPK
jgi:hypothetical protein